MLCCIEVWVAGIFRLFFLFQWRRIKLILIVLDEVLSSYKRFSLGHTGHFGDSFKTLDGWCTS